MEELINIEVSTGAYPVYFFILSVFGSFCILVIVTGIILLNTTKDIGNE